MAGRVEREALTCLPAPVAVAEERGDVVREREVLRGVHRAARQDRVRLAVVPAPQRDDAPFAHVERAARHDEAVGVVSADAVAAALGILRSFRPERLQVHALGVDRAAPQVEPARRPPVSHADADALGVQRPAVHRDPLVRRATFGRRRRTVIVVSGTDAVRDGHDGAVQDLDRAVVRPGVVPGEEVRGRHPRAVAEVQARAVAITDGAGAPGGDGPRHVDRGVRDEHDVVDAVSVGAEVVLSVDGDAADDRERRTLTRVHVVYLVEQFAGPAVDGDFAVRAERAVETGRILVEYRLSGLATVSEERDDAVQTSHKPGRVAGGDADRVALDARVVVDLRAGVSRAAVDLHGAAEVHRSGGTDHGRALGHGERPVEVAGLVDLEDAAVHGDRVREFRVRRVGGAEEQRPRAVLRERAGSGELFACDRQLVAGGKRHGDVSNRQVRDVVVGRPGGREHEVVRRRRRHGGRAAVPVAGRGEESVPRPARPRVRGRARSPCEHHHRGTRRTDSRSPHLALLLYGAHRVRGAQTSSGQNNT